MKKWGLDTDITSLIGMRRDDVDFVNLGVLASILEDDVLIYEKYFDGALVLRSSKDYTVDFAIDSIQVNFDSDVPAEPLCDFLPWGIRLDWKMSDYRKSFGEPYFSRKKNKILPAAINFRKQRLALQVEFEDEKILKLFFMSGATHF